MAPVNELAREIFDFGEQTLSLNGLGFELMIERVPMQRITEFGELFGAIAESRIALAKTLKA